MNQILFLGAGEIGTALAHVVQNRGHLEMWDKDPKRASGSNPLEQSVPLADIIFLCIPSWAVREVLATIVPFLRPKTILISLAKGMEEKTLKTMDVLLEESLPRLQPFALLGGPLLAEELMADLPGIGVVASSFPVIVEKLRPLFEGSSLRLEYTNDVHTVALMAVLKNVYAIGLGIAEGLNWGWNGKGWLAVQATQEMQGIIDVLGGRKEDVYNSAGMGDFFATAMSPNSRNRESGREIGLTGACTLPGEGCHSLPLLLSLLGETASQFPFLFSLDRIITKHENPKGVFYDFFRKTDI